MLPKKYIGGLNFMKKWGPIVLSSALIASSIGVSTGKTFAEDDTPVRNPEVIEDVIITDQELTTQVDSENKDLGYEMITVVEPEETPAVSEEIDMEVFVDPNEPKEHTEDVSAYKDGKKTKPVESLARKNDSGGSYVVVPNSSVYTWSYVNTTYGNNVAYNNVSNFLANAFVAGLSATVLGKISSTFFAGSAGYALGKLGIPKGTNYWYTVKKWIDQDAYNVYFKYEIKYYSNSTRTNLLKTYTYVERAT